MSTAAIDDLTAAIRALTAELRASRGSRAKPLAAPRVRRQRDPERLAREAASAAARVSSLVVPPLDDLARQRLRKAR